MKNNNSRLYDLDFLRFFAAMCVVLHHYTFRGAAADDLTEITFPLLSKFTVYGFLGVDLFFMVSGFVILMSTLKSNTTSFIISRIIRLYPAFWVSIAITSIFIITFNDPKFTVSLTQFFANLTMLNGFVYIPHIDGVYWTLMVELKFYFLIGLILFFNMTKYIHYFLYIWTAACFYNVFIGLPSKIEFFLFPEFANYFISGAAFYLLKKDGIQSSLIVLLLMSFSLVLFQLGMRADDFDNYYGTELSRPVLYFIITTFYLLFFCVALGKTKLINKASMAKYGALTYPLYLLHQNIGFLIINKLGHELNRYIILFITLSITILFSWAVNTYIEKKYSKELKVILQNLVLRMTRSKKNA
jgi:peptidoglycan/LPS O-acetylase OafA/YrhL